MPKRDEKRDPLALLPGSAAYLLFFTGMFVRSHRGDLWRHLAWMVGAAALAGLLTLADRQFRLRGVSRHVRVAAPVLAALLGLALLPVVLQTPLSRAIVVAGAMLALYGGTWAVRFGLFRRIGTPPACAGCGYERGEFADPADIPDRCPECGARWTRRGGIVEERFDRHPRFALAGAALWALGLSILATNLFPIGLFSAVLPTPALVVQLRSAQLVSEGAWTELQNRALTPEQRLEVVRILLDRQRDGDVPPIGASKWLDAQIAAGALPADLTERFFAELLRVHIEAPDSAKVGRSVTLRLRGPRGGYSLGYRAGGAVGGFCVDDAGEPAGRSAELIPEFHFSRHSPELNPSFTFVPDALGPVRVRVRLWVVVTTGSTWNTPITWNEDGSPVLHPTTVWSKRYDLEHAIDVRP